MADCRYEINLTGILLEQHLLATFSGANKDEKNGAVVMTLHLGWQKSPGDTSPQEDADDVSWDGEVALAKKQLAVFLMLHPRYLLAGCQLGYPIQ